MPEHTFECEVYQDKNIFEISGLCTLFWMWSTTLNLFRKSSYRLPALFYPPKETKNLWYMQYEIRPSLYIRKKKTEMRRY
jgi:hypothetical protein